MESNQSSPAPQHRLVGRLIRPERRRDLIGFSAVVSVDDSETYIAALRDQIIKKAGAAWMEIKYHNAVVGDFSAVEFRIDDRVCDMIICTRTAFNHCEVAHVAMPANARSSPGGATDPEPATNAVAAPVHGRVGRQSEDRTC